MADDPEPTSAYELRRRAPQRQFQGLGSSQSGKFSSAEIDSNFLRLFGRDRPQEDDTYASVGAEGYAANMGLPSFRLVFDQYGTWFLSGGATAFLPSRAGLIPSTDSSVTNGPKIRMYGQLSAIGSDNFQVQLLANPAADSGAVMEHQLDTGVNTWRPFVDNVSTLGTASYRWLNLFLSGTFNFGTAHQGDILYDNGTSWVRLTPGTAGKVLRTEGAGANPTWGYPADLTITSQVQGDILYFNGTNWVRLAPSTSGFFLKTQGAAANPVWAAVSAGATVTLNMYTAGDTWSKPTNAQVLHVICIAGGGGGGSGATAASGTAASGGSGGEGGGMTDAWIDADLAGTSVTITIGGGGGGGNAQTGSANNGNDGNDGGDTSFGTLVKAEGGDRGDHGVTGGGAAVGGAAEGLGNFLGGDGGAGGDTSTGTIGADSAGGAAGGGGGGGKSGTNVNAAGGTGGRNLAFSTAGGTGSSGSDVATTNAGGAPTDHANTDWQSGSGGGGSGSCTAGAGFNSGAGGKGADWGGGGGGSGAAEATGDTGAGGAGGNGICIVITYSYT